MSKLGASGTVGMRKFSPEILFKWVASHARFCRMRSVGMEPAGGQSNIVQLSASEWMDVKKVFAYLQRRETTLNERMMQASHEPLGKSSEGSICAEHSASRSPHD